MKILLVEDDHRISSTLRRGLEQEGFTVDVAFNGETGLEMALGNGFDIIVLDLMLPLMDGLEVCKNLRKQKNETPVLMLTAKAEVSDKVNGLNIGADDYLAKPFDFDELLARIKALGRRSREVTNEIICIKDLVLNKETFEVTRSGTVIDLSKKEYLLLLYLMENNNQVLTKEKIINKVWEFDNDILPNTVEVYIGYLRNKIDKPFKKSGLLIKTVRGFGYKITEK
jgi:two-component system OmpR family response regulator